MVDAQALIALVEAGQITVEPEALRLKVGTLEVDVDAYFHGTVSIDGKALAVRGLEFSGRAGHGVKVILDLVPVKKG